MALFPRTWGELSSRICDEKRLDEENRIQEVPTSSPLVEKTLWLTAVEVITSQVGLDLKEGPAFAMFSTLGRSERFVGNMLCG